MKKVAIVSCYFQKNYGSMIQAYATQKILDDMGIPNETICIDGIKKEINKSKIKHYLRQIGNPDIITGTFIRIGKKMLVKLVKGKSIGQNFAIRNKAFENFSQKNFRLSTSFSSKNDLMNHISDYSSVIVGSDQLWLPSNIDANYYTLNWVPDSMNKVAYATSFGTSFLPKYQHEKAHAFLSRIDHIAVREQSGQKLVKELSGKDVPIVCDPTLLFTGDEWMNIQSKDPLIEEKYIFCYFLGNNRTDRSFAKELKRITDYKIVALQHLDEYVKNDLNFADITPYNIGPGEFINLIRNAEYICTDSFHGSVFSILYAKKFFAFRRFIKEGILCTNNRLTSLFSLLHIQERLLSGKENVQECINREIDYDSVYKYLDEFRIFSMEYLKGVLIAND